MKLVNNPTDFGLLSVFGIGVEIELTDGKVLKTKNLGGHTTYTDFETISVGGEYAGGDFRVATYARKAPNDKVEITIYSKFDTKKVIGKFTQPLNYKSDMYLSYNGKGGALAEATP